MSNGKLICVLSGKKSSGKNTVARFIITEFLNRKIGQKRFTLEKKNKIIHIIDTFNNNRLITLDNPNKEADKIAETYSTKIYSFADPLKKICIDLLGIDEIQCYGSDCDKNSSTHIMWDNLPKELKVKYTKVKRGRGGRKPASGVMSAREVMQVLAEDMLRSLDENCFARGLYTTIEKENLDLSIICDCRYPNEVTLGTEKGAKVVRLLRNPHDDKHKSELALDAFPGGEFTIVIDNEDLSIQETQELIRPLIYQWFDEYKI